MKIRWVILILFIIGIFSFSSWIEAEDRKLKNKSQVTAQRQYFNLRDKIFSDMQIFEHTFQNDSDFLQLEQSMRQLLQDQLKGSLSDEEIQELLNPQSFGNAFESEPFGGINSRNVGSLEWEETDRARILKVKIKMPKDQSLSIKILKNQIKISGQIKSANRVSNFSQIEPVPSDCDPSQAKIEIDKQGFAQVILPKIIPSSNKNRLSPKPEVNEEKQPVNPSEHGVAI